MYYILVCLTCIKVLSWFLTSSGQLSRSLWSLVTLVLICLTSAVKESTVNLKKQRYKKFNKYQTNVLKTKFYTELWNCNLKPNSNWFCERMRIDRYDHELCYTDYSVRNIINIHKHQFHRRNEKVKDTLIWVFHISLWRA